MTSTRWTRGSGEVLWTYKPAPAARPARRSHLLRLGQPRRGPGRRHGLRLAAERLAGRARTDDRQSRLGARRSSNRGPATRSPRRRSTTKAPSTSAAPVASTASAAASPRSTPRPARSNGSRTRSPAPGKPNSQHLARQQRILETRRRRHLEHARPSTRRRTPFSSRPPTPRRTGTAPTGRVTTNGPPRSWRWTPAPARSNGATSRSTTTSGTTIAPSPTLLFNGEMNGEEGRSRRRALEDRLGLHPRPRNRQTDLSDPRGEGPPGSGPEDLGDAARADDPAVQPDPDQPGIGRKSRRSGRREHPEAEGRPRPRSSSRCRPIRTRST